MVIDSDMGMYKRNDHDYDHNDAIYDMFSPDQRCDPLAKIGFSTVICNKKPAETMTYTPMMVAV